MKNSRRGFVGLLFLIVGAILLVGGGVYTYLWLKDQSDYAKSIDSQLNDAGHTTVQSDPSLDNTKTSENNIGIIKYDQANAEQKTFLDKILAQYSVSGFEKDKIVLFYFDLTKNIAVVGTIPTADSLLVGFFHPATPDPSVAPAPFQQGPLIGVTCKNAASFSSSCIYVTKKYLVLFGGDDISLKGIYAYKVGDALYDATLLQKSWGSYVKEYDANYVPTLETSFAGKTITASLYKDNQYLGMGNFDLSKKNEYLRTVTFELN